ncbi:unnamed protein product [Lepeophtheirus salmonis]|uniref:(salmon louse) hypothetical protein n=1 Tax=Lepeophtheirus salmonis TaxID=72036 RepID=A0A7R8CVK1_LEPSM|nr:unnamed protein product [Lepeophtheirus salmonis]CAF2944407.1 unnamed protein product [Lepeophtheirus salmonis]
MSLKVWSFQSLIPISLNQVIHLLSLKKETSEPKTPVVTKRKSSGNSQSMKSANEKTKTKSPIAISSQTPVTIKSPTKVKTTVDGSGVKKISQPSFKHTRKESPSKPTGEYETNSPTTTNSHRESASESPSVSCEYFSSPSAFSNMSMQKERFAPYDDNRWVSIGKDLINNSFDAVQYTRALRLPFHLLSFLRIKGNSVKGMSCTDKNNMVFVVIEGEITVALQGSTSNFDSLLQLLNLAIPQKCNKLCGLNVYKVPYKYIFMAKC